MALKKRITLFLLSILITQSIYAVDRDEDEDYDQYIANLPIYEEPIALPKEPIAPGSLFKWVPSSHVNGLNILGLVPSFNIGVGRVSFESSKENSTLFEYNWGYRVFSWFNLAFSYQNQSMEFHDQVDSIWMLGKQKLRENASFALHSLMFKGYLEPPRVLRADRFFLAPYIALGAGPGWVQRGIFGATIRTWEGDAGIRFGAIHPISFISFMTGVKYIQWMDLGHSFVQYLGIRLNF